jgi:16S rRNA (adenine1518-N6/adenine1519-N6)-dimethyltransferase
MVLMFQKEVAQRLVAKPGSKTYGRLSVLAQWLCDCKIAFDVPASAFTPSPKVTSSIVRLVPREKVDGNFTAMEKLTAAAFGQRRKMLRGSLKEYLPLLEQCGIDATLRAEDLSVAQYASLARQTSFFYKNSS